MDQDIDRNHGSITSEYPILLSGNDSFNLDSLRREALEELDHAKFSFFHVKTCIVAGVGFFTDAYDLFTISIACTMLGYVYGSKDSTSQYHLSLNPSQELGIKVAAVVGNVFGQLFFGWLADILGRKRLYGIELILIIFTTFTQALSANGGAISIVGVLIVWRFIMGCGIGGDYPLSAVISSEFAPTRMRGRLMTAVFAAQGWGQLTSAIVATIVVAAFHNSLSQYTSDFPDAALEHVDRMWRILIGMGCVPACLALYFRLTIPETPRFTMDVERNVIQAALDIENILSTGKFWQYPDTVVRQVQTPRASFRDFIAYFSKWENGKLLLATTYSWFALDIAFYGLSFNSSNILIDIGFASVTSTPGTGVGAFNTLKDICEGNIILSLAGLIPGYWVSFLFIDTWGRKPIQLMGFIVLTVIFMIMGFAYDKLTAPHSNHAGFVFLYCLASFFQNFGPNTTTFIIPGEAFPTRYRSTAHGISAASGKIVAVIAQVVFFGVHSTGVQHVLEIFAFFMLTGIFSTLLLPETKGRTLEDISNECQDGFVRSESIDLTLKRPVSTSV